MASNRTDEFTAAAFHGRLNQQDVHFHVIRMSQAFFLWIGDDSKQLNDLAVAMPPLSVGGSVSPGVSTRLIGNNSMDALSQSIAQKLAKRTGCQVFVSVNLKNVDKSAELELQKRIIEELTINPRAFK